MIQTLEWTDQGVRFIDQTKLPTEETYVTCKTYEQVADVIRNMVVRGAPAIGVAAAMGIALAVKNSKAETTGELKRDFDLAPQQDPVGKAGQRVVMRHMGDLLLVALAFADVRKGANEAAVGQIDAAHLEHDAVRPRALVTAQDRR